MGKIPHPCRAIPLTGDNRRYRRLTVSCGAIQPREPVSRRVE